MQLRCTSLVMLLLACCFSSFAQYENKWFFGQRYVLDFSSGAPVFDTSGIIQLGEFADASVCDADGNFLFYTNGNQVWGRDTTLMLNGTSGMTGPTLYPDIAKETTQGALIVPMPGAPDKYYVFSLTSTSHDLFNSTDSLLTVTEAHKLYYSVVDMSLNNGHGDVVPGQKSILVDSNLRQGMVSITGNNCNVWVVVSDFKIPAFKAFEVTAAGVNSNPVISSVGIGGHPAADHGMLAASPDRTKLAATQNTGSNSQQSWYDPAVYGSNYGQTAAGLYDFDPATGLVSNPIILIHYFTPAAYANNLYAPLFDTSAADSTAYSVCFSPDNSKLYVNTDPNHRLYQYDISLGDAASIIASRTQVGTFATNASGFSCPMRLGPDGKLYFISGYKIGCIEYPNLAGTACGFNPDAVTIDYNSYPMDDWDADMSWPMTANGLPNVISVIKPHDTAYTVQDAAFCGTDTGILAAVALSSGWVHHWNTGATGDSLAVTAAGDYWVSYMTDDCTFRVDTFRVSFGTLGTPPVITANGHDLGTTITYDTYQWLLNGAIIPGATNAVYTAVENGDYSVVVGSEGGCSDTSAVYTVSDFTGVRDVQAMAKQIHVYPNPTSGAIYVKAPVPVNLDLTDITGRSMLSAGDATGLNLAGLARGVYLLRISDRKGNLIKVEKITKQ